MASKKEIYKEYGIEYKAGKIYSCGFGLVPEMLVNGNEKIGKGVYHFSTLPGTKLYKAVINGETIETKGTCVCDCIGCYAMTGNYRYQSVINALAIRTALARIALDFVKRAILAQIKADNIKTVRIHASGDFFNAEYIEMWKEIVTACQDTVFWTYTKNKAAESAFDGIENANIVKSVLPGGSLNFGHCDYIMDQYNKLKSAGNSVYICRCGIDKNQHCANCKGCSKNDFVLFIEHSTSYKAVNDPAFPVIRDLIESQPCQA